MTMNHDEPITMALFLVYHDSHGQERAKRKEDLRLWRGQRRASFSFASKPEALYLAVRCST